MLLAYTQIRIHHLSKSYMQGSLSALLFINLFYNGLFSIILKFFMKERCVCI